jgi:hypothetical protein
MNVLDSLTATALAVNNIIPTQFEDLLLQQLNKVKGIKHYNKTERSDN